MTRKKKIILLIIGGVVLSLAFQALILYISYITIWKQVDKYQIDEKTQTYLEAIVERDQEKLRSVSYDKDLDVQDLIHDLSKHFIFLSGEITLKRGYSVNINFGKGGIKISLRYTATVGEDQYTINVEYAKDGGGDGIRQIYFDYYY